MEGADRGTPDLNGCRGALRSVRHQSLSRGHGKAVTLHTLRELLGCVRTGILHEGTTGTTTVPAIVCLDRVPLRPPTPSVGRVLDMG